MINIQQVIYSNCIRYVHMVKLTKNAFMGYMDDELNIFIDLYPIYKTVLRNDYVDIRSEVDFCSSILNLCAHYRAFFEKYCATKTYIYIINSMNINNRSLQLYNDYNKEFIHRYNTRGNRIDSVLKLNIDLLETLVPYIPDVHMINSTYESSVVMYDIILNHGKNNPNLIISKDVYPRQLIGLLDKTVLYRPKFNNSYYVDKSNLYDSILYDNGSITKYDFSNISPALFSVLYSLNGMKCRTIKSLYRIDIAKRLLENAINNKYIINGYNSIIDWSLVQNKKDPNLFNINHNIIDIPIQHSIYKNDIECNYTLQNLYDAESVQAINNMYFTQNNQINLNDF